MKKNTSFLTAFVIVTAIFAVLFYRQLSHKEVYTVGVVSLTKVDKETFRGFKEAMETYGFVENRNIAYLNEGPAESIAKLDTIVQRQLTSDVDLFFVSSTPGTQAVKKATEGSDIPILFCPVNDPVASGIVKSLKYPGGHITGIKLPSGDRQRLQWLRKIVPGVKTILVPYTPGDKSSEFSRFQAAEAAKAFDIRLIEEPVKSETALHEVLERNGASIDAIFLPRDSSIESFIGEFVAYSDRHKLPLSAPSLQQVEQGALFTYGFIHYEMGRQAARLAQRILNGESPAALPVQTAKSYLVINIKTAKKIGLKIPDAILVEADRLINGD